MPMDIKITPIIMIMGRAKDTGATSNNLIMAIL